MTLVEILTQRHKHKPNACFQRVSGDEYIHTNYRWHVSGWGDLVTVNRPGGYSAMRADDILATDWEWKGEV